MALPVRGEAVRASVVRTAGVPRLALDREPVSGMAVMPCPYVPSGTAKAELRPFVKGGIRFASDLWRFGRKDGESRPWWIGEGEYDWDLFDAQALDLMVAVPGMLVFPRISLDPPKGWLEAHPGESLAGKPRAGSSAWRACYRRMLKDMVEHVERSPYANRIVGYHLGALHCGEWLVHPFDFEKGLPAVDWDARDPLPPLPVTAERRRRIREITGDVADETIAAARYLKELTHGTKLVGAFSGYVAFSHEEMRRVFRSGTVDFIAAPPHYGDSREPGSPGRSQAYFQASMRLHGIVFYEETDFRTFLSEKAYAPTGMTRCRPLDEADALLRRSLGKILSGGWENWWFLLGGNRSYDDPRLRETIRVGASVSRQTLNTAEWHPAEVAVFTAADEYATSYGTKALWFRDACKVQLHLRHLPTCGVPFDSYELGDIEDPRLPDYRVYVFPNAFTLTEAQRAAIERRVRQPGRTAVWVYAPGYYRNGAGSVSNVVALTGIDLEERYPVADGLASRQFSVRGASVRERDGARSVYLAEPPDAGTLRETFRTAGAHVWLETDDVLAAGRGFVMLHAASAGEKRLRLPGRFDAREIFEASPERKGTAEVVETLAAGETRVYAISGSK